MKLKLLFNGFRHGHINTLYQKAIASDAVDVVGCIEQNEQARNNAKNLLGATFSEKSYDEWLQEDIDVVAIGGAYGERGEAIIKALSAGKHVIADKPICTSLAQLEQIRKLASEKNLQVACMLDLRYLPQTLRVQEILESGRLGEIRNISFNGQHCIDYANRPTWYFEEGMHGGTINDLSIHGVDLVRILSKMEITKIDAARCWNAYATKNPDFKDCATFMARLENGAGVLADASYSAPSQVFSMPTYWEFKIWCEKGYLTFCYVQNSVTIYEEGNKEPVVLSGLPATRDYLDDLLDAIESGDRAMTEGVFTSTETALTIQAYADKETTI
jgi:predicted dehydrogenase